MCGMICLQQKHKNMTHFVCHYRYDSVQHLLQSHPVEVKGHFCLNELLHLQYFCLFPSTESGSLKKNCATAKLSGVPEILLSMNTK